MKRNPRTQLVATVVGLALLVAACGDDDDDDGASATSDGAATPNTEVATSVATTPGDTAAAGTGTTGSEAPAGGGVESAQAFLDENIANPTELPLKTPLSKRPEAGMHIVTCETAQPVAAVKDDGIAEAAELLGWEYTRLPLGTGAEDPSRCMQEAIDQQPDGIHISGVPKATYAQQLAAAEEAGIPVVTDSTTDPTGDGIVQSLLDGPTQVEFWGRLGGAFVVADSGGEANLLIFNIPDFPILTAWEEGVRGAVEEWCENCTVETVNQQAADLGTSLPSNVVSNLQRDSEVDYIAFAFGDMTLGVTAALQAANLTDQVKIIGETPSDANIQALRDGTESGWAALSAPILGWMVVDAFARQFNGDPQITDDQVFTPTQWLTPETIDQAVLEGDTYVGLEDYRDQFAELWMVE